MNWVLAAGAGGFNPPTEEEFHWPPIFEIHLGAVDLSINRPVILTWLVVLIVGGLLYAAFAKPKLIPGKFQNLMETAVEFVRKEIIIEVLGPEHGPRWVPYLTTLFFFVFVGNLFEVIPLINLPTNFRSANTWFLAIFSLIIFVSVGIASQGPVKYLKSVMAPPGVPV
ncbi:MAG TPA: F0F1 ATP synthase subunit A, partial [Actinomycetota bacterium]|nr:F0F1 ATP synthase subunit A [Actinomycetota bacterium]